MKHWIAKSWIFLLLAVVVAGCPERRDSGNVLATFDGGRLTVEDVQAHLAKLKRTPRYRNNPEMLTSEFAFEHAVNMEMIIARGLKEELHLDPRIRAEIHDHMADLFLKIMQDSLVPKIDKENFTEEEVRAYFDAHPDSYATPALYDVRIIKAGDEASLKPVAEQLAGGAVTFDEAARKHSTDERTRDKGGATGLRDLKGFPPAWREVIGGLKAGEVSAPVPAGTSWYLFKLAAKTEPVPYEYEDRKAYVRNDLLYSRYREAWQETYANLKKEFSLKVEEARLKDFLKGEKP